MTTVVELLEGDCLEHLAALPASSVDLAYLDPPFNTGRVHVARQAQFDDRWRDVDAYIAFLREHAEEYGIPS